jgi:hypothetical protein
MKKIIPLLTVVLLINTCASAQFNKGNFIIGGSMEANFVTSTDSGYHNYHFAANPRFGYYFYKGFAAGIDLTAALNMTGTQKTNQFGGGPFVRYHILHYLYAEASYQYLLLSHNAESEEKTGISYPYENKYAAGLGYIIRLNNHIALEPRIFYDVYTSHGSGVASGPVFSIGFNHYF